MTSNVNPLVSVIIPNYNHAEYLEERIESILSQTFQDFELIILDDMSTDNSKEVIERYRYNKHVNSIIYNKENSGSTFKQWLKGISLAKGKLIWIAESDDSCRPNMLAYLVDEFAKDRGLVLAFCNSMVIDENGRNLDIIQAKKWRKNISTSGKEFIHDYLYQDNVVYNASSALFKKDVALEIDKQYIRFKGSGDWLFWIEICEKGNVSMLKSPLNLFRKHLDNVTTKMRCNGIQQIENKKIFDYLTSNNLISQKAAIIHKLNILCAYKYFINFESEEVKSEAINAWNPSQLDNIIVYLLYIFRFIKHSVKNFVMPKK